MATFKNGDASIWYEVHGTGTPVVLIHGLGSSALDWEYQLDGLPGYQLIALDLRGHGRSSRAPVPISMKLFGDDIAALLCELNVPSAHIVGVSLGGGIAFQFALDYPQMVKSLVIVNSGPHAVMETLAARFAIWLRFVVIRLFGLPALANMVAKKIFPRPQDAQKLQTFVERFQNNDRESYTRTLRALMGWTVQDRLGEIQQPVLSLAADQDYTPVSWKEEYVRKLPNATLKIIEDSRHAMPMERPEPFNAALLEFLNQQPR